MIVKAYYDDGHFDVFDTLTLVDVDGADAAAFLNGQLSSEVLALERGRAQWTSYNSPKGRMLANPLLYRPLGGPAFRLVLPVDIAEAVRKNGLRNVTLLTVAICSKAASSTASTLPNSSRMRSTWLPCMDTNTTPSAKAMR